MYRFTGFQLDHLRAEWKSLSRLPASKAAAQVLHARFPGHAELGYRDLGELLVLLDSSSRLAAPARHTIAADLLEAAKEHELIKRALLQTSLPGLVGVGRKLGFDRLHRADPAGLLGDLVATCYEVICDWAGERRSYAIPDILNAVLHRCRRQLRALEAPSDTPFERSELLAHAPASHDEDPFAAIPALIEGLGHEVDPMAAAALYGNLVLGYSYAELSRRLGQPVHRLRKLAKDLASELAA